MPRLRPKTMSPPRAPLYARSKGKVTEERKENTYAGAKTDTERRRSPPVLINLNLKFVKNNEPVLTPSKTRYLTENEPKPKTLSTKRRNILAIRKPNSGKVGGGVAGSGGVVKTKSSRRSVEDTESGRQSIVTAKLGKRSFSRSIRGPAVRAGLRCKPMPSSSSSDMLGGSWEEAAGGSVLAEAVAGKRRPFPNPAPSHLKKIRLKTGL